MVNSPQFLQAAEAVKTLNKKPDNDSLSVLYGLYKQATVGDNNTPKPGMLDMKGNVKWNSWNTYKGYSKYKAEIEYITFVNSLLEND